MVWGKENIYSYRVRLIFYFISTLYHKREHAGYSQSAPVLKTLLTFSKPVTLISKNPPIAFGAGKLRTHVLAEVISRPEHACAG
jgi:hypothetical protein